MIKSVTESAIGLILVMLLLISSCLHYDVDINAESALAPTVIQLIPPPSIGNRSVTAVGSKFQNYNIITIDYIYFDPCLWNIDQRDPSISGSTIMTLSASGLEVLTKFSYVKGAGSGWFQDFIGYHRVGYGHHPWESKPYATPSPYLSLPMKISDLPRILAEVNYTILYKELGWMDIAFDIWLKRSPPPRRGMALGDLEIMVWLYWLPPLPGGSMNVGMFSVPMLVNSSLIRANFTVYLVPIVSQPEPGGWTWIIFVLNTPIERGHIVLDLTRFIELSKDIILSSFPLEAPRWSPEQFDSMYLWDIEFGSEIARLSNGSAHLNWVLDKYSFYLFNRRIDTESSLRTLIGDISGLRVVETLTSVVPSTTTLINTFRITSSLTVTVSMLYTVTSVTTAVETSTTTIERVEKTYPCLYGMVSLAVSMVVVYEVLKRRSGN